MAKKTIYEKYINRRVRRKNDPHNRSIGYIAERAVTSGWWIVEWPDGKRSQHPPRGLEFIDPEEEPNQ